MHNYLFLSPYLSFFLCFFLFFANFQFSSLETLHSCPLQFHWQRLCELQAWYHRGHQFPNSSCFPKTLHLPISGKQQELRNPWCPQLLLMYVSFCMIPHGSSFYKPCLLFFLFFLLSVSLLFNFVQLIKDVIIQDLDVRSLHSA